MGFVTNNDRDLITLINVLEKYDGKEFPNEREDVLINQNKYAFV